MQRAEGSLHGFKDCELFYQTWTKRNNFGTLVVTHGLAEHSECYNVFANGMVDKGWDVLAWDLRGHGRSEGKRGLVGTFDDYSRDLVCLLECLKRDSGISSKPVVLVGHSMGGLVNLRMMIDFGNLGLTAATFSSPLLGINMEVPKIKDMAAKMLVNVLPRMTMHNEIRYEDLTRDKQILKEYPADPFRHDKISPALYLGILESIDYVTEKAGKIDLPVLFQLSGNERVVNTPKSKDFFERLSCPRKELKIYPHSLHEIFNDLDREQVFRDLKDFLQEVTKK